MLLTSLPVELNQIYFLLFAGIDETVEQVRAAGGSCVGYKVDISKKEEVYKAADAIRRDAGDVSIFFCFTTKNSTNCKIPNTLAVVILFCVFMAWK